MTQKCSPSFIFLVIDARFPKILHKYRTHHSEKSCFFVFQILKFLAKDDITKLIKCLIFKTNNDHSMVVSKRTCHKDPETEKNLKYINPNKSLNFLPF